MFLYRCYITNIKDIGTCDDAWYKSVNNGWVRSSDSYCNVSRNNFDKNLMEFMEEELNKD